MILQKPIALYMYMSARHTHACRVNVKVAFANPMLIKVTVAFSNPMLVYYENSVPYLTILRT